MDLLFEDFFVFIILILSTGAFVSIGSTQGSDPNEGGGAMLAIWILLYCATLWRVFGRPSQLIRMMLWQRLIVLLSLLAMVSTVWSVDPATTARRSVAVLLTTVFALYFATRYTHLQQLRMISRALAIIAVASLFAAVLVPGVGIESGGALGDWRGVFGFKNDLGRVMALSALASGSLFLEDRAGRLVNFAIASLSIALLLLSRSTTSALVLFGVLFVAVFDRLVLMRLSRHQVAAVIALVPIIAGMATVAVIEGTGAALQFLGKDRTLTGRTVLWGFVMMNIAQRPWTGFGYNAFWSAAQGSSIRDNLHWFIFQAHDGYLQLALDVGLIGVGVFICSCLLTLVRLLQPTGNIPEGQSRWPFLFLIFYLISNLTESSILVRNSIFWIMYVGAVCFASRIKSARSVEPSSAYSVQAADVV